MLSSENALIEAEKLKIGEEVEKELRQTYANYQKQHNDYERHILAQINALQNQIAKIQGKGCALRIEFKCFWRLEVRVERTRMQNVKYEERLVPKAPYYELPAGMIVPLVKPESVTFEAIDSSLLRLPAPDLLTDRLKGEVERFYSLLHNPPSDRFDRYRMLVLFKPTDTHLVRVGRSKVLVNSTPSKTTTNVNWRRS